MTDRKLVYSEEAGDAAGFPTEITEETEIWGFGTLAQRPATGENTGDLFFLDDGGGNIVIQRWNGVSWQDASASFLGSTVGAHGDIIYRNASAWVVLPAGTSGQFLKTNGSGANPQWDTPAGGGGAAADLATVVRRNTSGQVIPDTVLTDVVFPTVDVENDDTIVEADGTNTDRIIVKETGLYLVSYSLNLSSNPSSAQTVQWDIQVRVNDSTILQESRGSDSHPDQVDFHEHNVTRTFFVELTANDFLTVRASRTVAAGTFRIDSNSVFVVARAQGPTGEQGPPGTGSTVAVEDEGVTVTNSPFSTINFTGAGVSAADGGGGTVDVTIPGGGGGGLTPDDFSAYNASASGSITGATTLPISTERFSSGATYSLASNVVTVNTTGRYKITADVSLISTSGGRTQGQSWVEINSTEESGTRMLHYCRQTNHGASGSASLIIDLTAGDEIRLRAQRTAGTGTIVARADGVRLTIENR